MQLVDSASRAARVLLVCGLAALSAHLHAAPDKPLMIIVGGAPGGIDNPIRAMASTLSAKLGQPVVVDNKPGANGLIAANAVARAEPDGNTLLYTTVSTMVLAPLLQKQAIEPVKALVPVANVYDSFQVLAVSSKVPVKTVSELIAYAKANPGKLNYVSSGNGSLFHLIGELFKQRAGVNLTHIPQKALSPAVQDLVGGHVDLGFLSFNVVQPHAASGKLRVLAVMSPQRLELSPDTPSINETIRDFPALSSWIGVAAPAGTQSSRLTQLHRAISEGLAVKEVRDLILKEGGVPGGKDSEAMIRTIRNDSALAAQIIDAAGIQPE